MLVEQSLDQKKEKRTWMFLETEKCCIRTGKIEEIR